MQDGNGFTEDVEMTYEKTMSECFNDKKECRVKKGWTEMFADIVAASKMTNENSAL